MLSGVLLLGINFWPKAMDCLSVRESEASTDLLLRSLRHMNVTTMLENKATMESDPVKVQN